MKKIEVIARPEKFQELRDHLYGIGIGGLTVTEAAGTGRQKGKQGLFRGTTFEIEVLPKLKIELVVEDQQVDEVVSLIMETCDTGTIGDGKIFIIPVEESIRIRTGEKGKEAIL
ncbi:P-II family nitrogen regulator [Alteribacillus iranensis]|uniref:Nitrogen regulatory protein P-II family n=1 Tax=Alteribacillus iranensis TaxID=930128 RepID=A0A1I2DS37_9BACI|nr:P-II family nitrogen regulator [Alteribacillus iranensis]SFE83462.1 nitrogen regulatory protein P-II family [Alteribacillus iranensis]